MALDATGLAMIAKLVPGSAILCLGYPDITAPVDQVKALLGVEPRAWTDHGGAHKVKWRLPETVDTLLLAGAAVVDCIDSMPSRGVEKTYDLNVRHSAHLGFECGRAARYGLVLNPGTLEHCFDIATAMFNAWRAVAPGGFILHVAPLSMLNHGFWNVCPTALVDFACANGGTVIRMLAKDRSGEEVPVAPLARFRVPPESVLYALVRKDSQVPEVMPVQSRFRT